MWLNTILIVKCRSAKKKIVGVSRSFSQKKSLDSFPRIIYMHIFLDSRKKRLGKFVRSFVRSSFSPALFFSELFLSFFFFIQRCRTLRPKGKDFLALFSLVGGISMLVAGGLKLPPPTLAVRTCMSIAVARASC